MCAWTRECDPDACLGSDELIAECVAAAFEDGTSGAFLSAAGGEARARGMSAIADGTGLGRESLHRALAPTALTGFGTVFSELNCLGVKLNGTSQPRHRKAVHPCVQPGRPQRGFNQVRIGPTRRSADSGGRQ